MLSSPDTKIKCSSDTNLSRAPAASDEQYNRKRKQPESEFSEAIGALRLDLMNTLSDWRRDMDTRLTVISDSVTNITTDLAALTQVISEIKSDISFLRSEQLSIKQSVKNQDDKHNALSQELIEIRNSVQSALDEQTDIQRQVAGLGKQEQITADLQMTVCGLVAKIDYMEQNARSCNIELCNIPERRGENLITLIENIGSKINLKVTQKDIVAIHRVPHAHEQNDRPKNIIVKFTSRILRDNMLSACRLFKNLNANLLGFSNSALPVYVHEHLTLKNKQLFRECRAAAARHNFKFVWVKNGTILTREKEGARVFVIKSLQDVDKIKPGSPKTGSSVPNH